MPQEGFLNQKPRSPGGLVIVLAAHAAVLTALALSKMEMPDIADYGFTEVRNIPIKPPPEPIPPEPKVDNKPFPKSVVDSVPPRVPDTPTDNPIIRDPVPPPLPIPSAGTYPGTGAFDPVIPRPLPPPPVPPVRIEPQIDPRSELQPPYPASEERLGNEGTVVVRVQIGTDGRVKEVSRIRATSEAFWRVTERHVLRHWRFRPATLDGKPVESSKTMTLHFRLPD